jgi:hypothetical protein
MTGQIEIAAVRPLFSCEESRKGLHQEACRASKFSREQERLIVRRPAEAQPGFFVREFNEVLSPTGITSSFANP